MISSILTHAWTFRFIAVIVLTACAGPTGKKPVNSLYGELDQNRVAVATLGCTLEPMLEEPNASVVVCESASIDVMSDRLPALAAWARTLTEASGHPDLTAEQRQRYRYLASIVHQSFVQSGDLLTQTLLELRKKDEWVEIFLKDLSLNLDLYHQRLLSLDCDFHSEVEEDNACSELWMAEKIRIRSELKKFVSSKFSDFQSMSHLNLNPDEHEKILWILDQLNHISTYLSLHISSNHKEKSTALLVAYNFLVEEFGLRVTDGADFTKPVSEVRFVLPAHARSQDSLEKLEEALVDFIHLAEAYFYDFGGYPPPGDLTEKMIFKYYQAILKAHQLDLSLEDLEQVPPPMVLPR